MKLFFHILLIYQINEILSISLIVFFGLLTYVLTTFILGYIPEQLHSTVGASYILAKAAIEQGYTYDVNKAIDITLGWKDNFNIAIKGEF